MGKTDIEWTDKTWNPTRGCERISPGCQNCYAERIATRFSGPGKPYDGLIKLLGKRHPQTGNVPGGTRGRWNGEARLITEHLGDPLHWRKPAKIFVDSMSDLFLDALSNYEIAAVYGVMMTCQQHTFQVLTKRPQRRREWFGWVESMPGGAVNTCRNAARYMLPDHEKGYALTDGPGWPLPNVWEGTSTENQETADERIPELLATPAAVRFLSIEPLLGPVFLTTGWPGGSFCRPDQFTGKRIDWAIIGEESGPGARAADVRWTRDLIAQLTSAAAPVFLKQMRGGRSGDGVTAGPGSRVHGKMIGLPYLDGKQYAQFPAEVLR